ncbi:hypothetical protein T484DRAFT_1957519 [Baffinella frigidus]|nr:hypothetical protein T484DRAFT_1957519 [Cryptophyta sp. CCMP2293]
MTRRACEREGSMSRSKRAKGTDAEGDGGAERHDVAFARRFMSEIPVRDAMMQNATKPPCTLHPTP